MNQFKKAFAVGLLLLLTLSGCASIVKARFERFNTPHHTYQDARGKWHTIIGVLICCMVLFSCRIYKIDKAGKQVYTWNTKHLRYIHPSLAKNTFFAKKS
jgi:hypothetical protein